MINRFKWLEVKPETRVNIVAFLNSLDNPQKLVRTGCVEVAGNRVVCDGFTDQDLCAITSELLIEALGEKTLDEAKINKSDIYALFYELVRRLEAPVTVIPEEIKEVEEKKVEEITPEVKVEEKKVVKKTNK